MTLLFSNAKIIVETDADRFEFDAPQADIGSGDGGATHFLNTSPLLNMVRTPTLRPLPTNAYIDNSKLTDPPMNPGQAQALKLLAGKARHIERQHFHNARRIQEVQEQVQADLNSVTHDFNLSVLGATHEGLTYDQITAYLESLKLEGFEDTVQYAVDGDVDYAYPDVEG